MPDVRLRYTPNRQARKRGALPGLPRVEFSELNVLYIPFREATPSTGP